MIEGWKKALVLAPHTDDGELGCGGTMARLVEGGCDVRYVAFSIATRSLPPGFEPDTSIVYNSSGRIRNPVLRFAWTNSNPLRARLQPWLPRPVREAGWALVQRNLSRPPLPPDLRAQLVERYRPDVLALEKRIGRDLSGWLT